jgi:hypothetical protein
MLQVHIDIAKISTAVAADLKCADTTYRVIPSNHRAK